MRYIDYLNSIGDRERWQDTANEIKLFAFDWRLCIAFFPILFGLLNPYAWLLSISIVIFCQVLKMYGISLPILGRLIHYKIVRKKARGLYGYEKNRYRS